MGHDGVEYKILALGIGTGLVFSEFAVRFGLLFMA